MTTAFRSISPGKPAQAAAVSYAADNLVAIYETAASGRKMERIAPTASAASAVELVILPQETFQRITGFGGSFTQVAADVLGRLSPANQEKILSAYFSTTGAAYSLTRTPINSCDFSLYPYAYNQTPGDVLLGQFDISEDQKGIIPMIKAAQTFSGDGFRIIASPWTAPPWMKDNNDWVGGKLLPEYYPVWALYFSRYIEAYKKEGISIWGVTVENEPHGNGNNWESMLFSPKEMTDFVEYHLGPRLEKDGFGEVNIFGYDQNRAGLKEWVDEMYRSPDSSRYYAGTAVHWYESTFDYFGNNLDYAHHIAPSKYLINTEACIDADVPRWQDDDWYWSEDATDWGWDWASEDRKHLHPRYVPVFRYARDIIGCLNHYVDGWIDWNMVLDKQGGPNHVKNWCIAPVIASPETDEVYFTPLYYTMAHFSRFIRPGAFRIGFRNPGGNLMMTAAKNPDGSVVVILFNAEEKGRHVTISLQDQHIHSFIQAKAIQTIVFQNAKNKNYDS